MQLFAFMSVNVNLLDACWSDAKDLNFHQFCIRHQLIFFHHWNRMSFEKFVWHVSFWIKTTELLHSKVNWPYKFPVKLFSVVKNLHWIWYFEWFSALKFKWTHIFMERTSFVQKNWKNGTMPASVFHRRSFHNSIQILNRYFRLYKCKFVPTVIEEWRKNC